MTNFKKIIIFSILFFTFCNFSAYSEVVNKVVVKGNERISSETIAIFGDVMLGKNYEEAVKKWNEKMAFSKYPDAGFDIFTPADQIRNSTDTSKQYKINFNIKTAMYKNNKPVSFTMHPRSSIYKTPFRLTNNTGIIDAGYRGNLGAVFDVLPEQATQQNPFERFVQVCAPSLEPFCIHLVENESELGLDTERGTGGFGSTGR